MKKFNEWTKKRKVVTGVVVVGLLIGGGASVKAYEDYQYKQEIVTTKKALKSEFISLEALSKAVEQLRDKENPNFLINDVTLLDLENIDKQLSNLKSEHKSTNLVQMKEFNQKVTVLFSDVTSNADAVEFQLKSQEEVNGLFQSDKSVAIKGSEINKELPLADDVTIAEIETVVKNTRNKDLLSVIPTSTNKDLSWEQAINSLTDEAMTQAKVIDEVSKAVDSFYKDGKAIDTTDLKKVKEADKKANTIKNEKAKKDLVAKIKVVSEAVTKKQKADAEKEAKTSGGKVVAQADGSFKVEKETSPNTSETANNGSSNQSNNDYSNSNQDSSGGGYTSPTNNGSGGYTPPANNGGGGNTPPANNGNGNNSSSNNGGGSSSSNGGGDWSGTGDKTGGGDISDNGNSNSATGGGNQWEGGDFDGSGIPDW